MTAARCLDDRQLTVPRPRPLGNDDDAESGTPVIAILNALRNLVEIVRDLRDEDDIGATGHAAMQRDPPRVPSHDFHHHDAAMRLRSGVESIDRFGREADCGVEAETARRADDVVVDCLGNANERNPLLVELVGDGERSVAANADERVKLRLLEHLHDAVGVVEGPLRGCNRLRKWIAAIDRAENRAPEPKDAGYVPWRERTRLVRIDQTVEAVFEPDHRDTSVVRRLDHGADHGVEAGRIAAARQNADLLDGWHVVNRVEVGLPAEARIVQRRARLRSRRELRRATFT
jgi:hypothetical protein